MEVANIPILSMLVSSGWVARAIVFILLAFSVVTWTLIFNRWIFLSKIEKLNRLFRSQFEGFQSITEIDHADKKSEGAPFRLLGAIALSEFKRILHDAKTHTGVKDWSFFIQNQFQMASERLTSSVTSLSSNLDRGLIFLAVVSSVAPFVGLLGTVWGIMNSFFAIGNQGSASLPVVAPGIAEALITTAAGLAVAIPAVFFYNLFMRRVQRVEDEIDEFGDTLFFRLKRDILSLLYAEKQERKTGPGGQA
jgi:biopolymer transport protein TolQ